MAAILIERAQVAARIESVKGTANAPIAADAGIEIYDLSYEVTVDHFERPTLGASFDTPVSVPGTRMVEFSFRVPVKGRLAAGQAPEHDVLLRACCVAKTVTSVVTYDPVSAESLQETATVDLYVDGKRIRVLGVMGNALVTLTNGDVNTIEFTMRGIFDDETDTALLTDPPYIEIAPPSSVGVTLTHKSVTMIATTFTLDFGNDVQLRPSMAEAGGYLHAVVVNREPQATIDPEDELVATIDFLGELASSNVAELLASWGSAAGNTFRVQMPAAQLVAAPYADRNSLRTRNLTFKPRRATIVGENAFNLRWS